MLVLSRKKDERIVIGDDISICVVEIRGDKVRLGIEAPHEITIHRQEVYDAIKAEARARDQGAGVSNSAEAQSVLPSDQPLTPDL